LFSFELKSGVKIYGGFAGGEKALRERSLDPSLTVLSGDIGTPDVDTDNSFHVVYADGVTGAVLDGFTVTRGYGDDNSEGAGMYNINSALTVANCIFSYNKVAVGTVYYWATGRGGGMYNKNSAPIVTNCIFSGNQAGNASSNKLGAGGGMYNEGYFNTGAELKWPVITGCTFSDNLASPKWNPLQPYGGGGMYNNNCSPTIDRCTFERNLAGLGGGMLNFSGQPIITNCIFNANNNYYGDGHGGAIYNKARATILNCTFYRNGRLIRPNTTASWTYAGGAIYDYLGGATIFNCIFSENAASALGGAIGAYSTSHHWTTVINCLFYENLQLGYQGEVSPSHVFGGLAGLNPDSINNLYDIDPLLVNPAGGDFHLRYDSPCVDAGYALTFGYLPHPYPFGLPATDFEGDRRIVDSDGDGAPAIDIGVDEVVPNIPDLGAFLQALANGGQIEQTVAEGLLAYVDAAQAALDQEEEGTAISFLNELIADVRASLGDTETAQAIEIKTQAVIEEI
jgi:hypothetical protein